MKRKRTLLTVAASLATILQFSAQAQTIHARAKFDTTAIMIGDQIMLHIEVERQQNVHAEFPAWRDSAARGIEVIETFPVDSAPAAGDMIRMTQQILVTSFDSGRHVLPPVHIPFTHDGVRDTISTMPAYLDVMTVPADTTQNIADIKDVYAMPLAWDDIWPWLLRGGLILLAAAIILFIIIIIMRRRSNRPVFGTPRPAELPHIIALRELDRLRSQKLWQNNRIKEYHTRLSDIVRTYIEQRFGVTAMEMTSDEIISGLNGTGFEDNRLINCLRSMFQLADMVKFAKATPLPDENESSLLDSYLFVNNTKVEIVAGTEQKPEEQTAGTDGAPENIKNAE